MIAFWLLLAALVLGLVLYVRRYRRRTAALRALASSRGWSYTYAASPAFTRDLAVSPFGEGGQRSVNHLVEGSVGGRAFRAFDYRVSAGDRSKHWGVVVTSLPADLPAIGIHRRVVGSDALHGVPALATESEAFDRAAYITTDDARTASAVLSPSVLALVENRLDLLVDLHLRGGDVASVGRPIATSTDLVARVEALCAFADAVPGFVVRDHPSARADEPTD